MMAEFLANPEGKRKKPKSEPKPMKRTRIKPVSEDLEKLKKRWAMIKASMIESQVKTNGYTSCMECGAINPRMLQLDHIIPAGNGGVWFPSNGQLLCSGPGSCHARKHGEPEWTRSEQAFEDKFKDGEPFPDESPGR